MRPDQESGRYNYIEIYLSTRNLDAEGRPIYRGGASLAAPSLPGRWLIKAVEGRPFAISDRRPTAPAMIRSL
jgi:hypothetical protein